eukprot:7388753-Prymnesium_polylepis.1
MVVSGASPTLRAPRPTSTRIAAAGHHRVLGACPPTAKPPTAAYPPPCTVAGSCSRTVLREEKRVQNNSHLSESGLPNDTFAKTS